MTPDFSTLKVIKATSARIKILTVKKECLKKKRKWNLLCITRALNELLCCPLSWPPMKTDGSDALRRLSLCVCGLSEGYINAVSAHSFSPVSPETSQL